MTGLIREHSLRSTGLAMAIIGVLTASAIAQQQAPAGLQAQEEALKRNVQVYEMALQNAIIKAGVNVAQWARKIEPSVDLAFAAQPEVRAIPLLDNSLVFHVDVSEMGMGISSQLWYEIARQKGSLGPQPRAGASRVGGTAAAAPDSVVSTPNVTPGEYMTEQVREELIKAVLDAATILPTLAAGQTLTVACNPVDVLQRNPLYRNQSRKLVLQIKGEDLIALRDGKISRDEARQRIIERRF
jgi:type II secretory pathway pseudopilin PulG